MTDLPWLRSYDPQVPAQLTYPAVPLTYYLRQAARNYPNRACTRLDNYSVSFKDLDELTDRIAAGLAKAGLHPGDRTGLLLPNLPQFVAAYFSILKAGGVVVAMNPAYTPREIQAQAADAGVSLLICLEDAYPVVKSIQAQTPVRRILVTRPEEAFVDGQQFLRGKVGENQAALGPQDGYLWELSGMPSGPLREISPDAPAIFQYSGGTTGTPKAAIGLHRNLVANTLQFRHWMWNLRDGEETLLLAIPMFHVYGMVLGMNLSVVMSASMSLIPNPRDLTAILRAVEHHQPAVFPGAPALYNAMVRNPDVLAADLLCLKNCISGSAPLAKETQAAFQRLIGGRLVEGYGLSEAPTATHCNPFGGENRLGTIGLPLPDVDCQIVSLQDGRTSLLPGEVGELVLRGPQVMQGYHNLPEETEIALRDGWLHTGDIARMDVDGYFTIIDRKKDLIKVGGLQVWPREIEEILMLHPAVQDAAAAGVPAELRGETVKAWVVLIPATNVSQEELVEWCARSLARYKVPREIEFRSQFPRTTVGKLLRRELVREHLEGK